MTPLTRPVCGRTAGAVRPGHRPGGPWTQAVRAVLCHLEGAPVRECARVVGHDE